MSRFGADWARQKLDMPRRRRELEAYVDRWLPELRTMESGVVFDVGCGPGDFLAMCRDMGHEAWGIDAKSGNGGMGDAYLDECRRTRHELEVSCTECDRLSEWPALCEGNRGACACINARGSIEQCLSDFMVGPAHHLHHNCRQLDWNKDCAGEQLLSFVGTASKALRSGGILLISANGTKSTDEWYDQTIQRAADEAGLELVDQDGLLTQKWRKP